MIDDPIVIRKAKGNLIVSSSKETDPIQLVRQLPDNQLEVHLKNGSKYIEDLDDTDAHEVILEMMGYGPMEVEFNFTAWPDSQSGTLDFVKDTDLHQAGQHAFNMVFSETPYMNSKLFSVELYEDEEPDIKFYDTTYSRYEVSVIFKFRGRVDMKAAISEEFNKNSIAYNISKLFFQYSGYGRHVGTNDFDATVRVIE